MRHEYRDGHSSQHAAGDTAKYELAQTRVAVTTHHNEIHVLISRMGEQHGGNIHIAKRYPLDHYVEPVVS